MIKQIIVNDETFINVLPEKKVLIELGLSDAQADNAIANHNSEQELNLIREWRAPLLIEADHLFNTALDNKVDTTPYCQYRQQLRDITKTNKTLKGTTWPQKPSLPQASS